MSYEDNKRLKVFEIHDLKISECAKFLLVSYVQGQKSKVKRFPFEDAVPVDYTYMAHHPVNIANTPYPRDLASLTNFATQRYSMSSRNVPHRIQLKLLR